MFIPYEAETILNIPICEDNQPDTFTWGFTTDGSYTVKTGYQAIMEWEEDADINSARVSSNDPSVWDTIWKLNVPPKYSHLLWRIKNKAIPVKSYLLKRGVNCDTLCPMCCTATETMDHTFLQCTYAKQVWFSSSLNINMESMQIQRIIDWIDYMTTATDKESMEKIAAIIYNIWTARNSKVFQQKDLPPSKVSIDAIAFLGEFQLQNSSAKASSSSSEPACKSNNISWSPPPIGSWKLNVDAHHRSDGDGRSFSGIVLRRSDGNAVGACTRVHDGVRDALAVEALGLLDALKFVERNRLGSVMIELDSLYLVKLVNSRRQIWKWWSFVVHRCQRFLQDNPSSSVCWIRRSGNKVADCLAKWAVSEPNKDWADNLPHCLASYIHNDIRGCISNS